MVCPAGTSCEEVVHSEFSKFLGIPLELIGLFYYGLIFTGYAAFLIFPGIIVLPLPSFLFLVLSFSAFLFSAYLTFVQAFFLRQWCTWCLISAAISTFIFILAAYFSGAETMTMLKRYRELIVIIHFFGVALGLGAATVADVLFFKFLKDLRISEWEADVLRAISQIVWFALAVIVVAGLELYLPEAVGLNQSPKFLVKMIAFIVLVLNGALLNLLIAPRLVRITFGKRHEHWPGELSYLRRWAFVLGGVSMASWYSVFVLGLLPGSLKVGFLPLFYIYIGVLVLAVVAGRLVERGFTIRSG